MKRTLILLVLSTLSLLVEAQVPQVLFYGYIEEGIFDDGVIHNGKKKKVEAKKLDDVKIFVYIGDSLQRTLYGRNTGFYAALLDAGSKYRVVFEKEGYFCKGFELDCTHVEYDTEEGAIKCLTDVSLFREVDDSSLLTLCKVPFARSKFDMASKEMAWDVEYTQRTKEKFYELAEPYYTAQKK